MYDPKRGACAALALWLALWCAASPSRAVARPAETAREATPGRRAHAPSATVTRLAEQVIASGDNGALPFVIVDKVAARVFVFAADGQALGDAPALLGYARGDNSSPGVGDREVSAIPLSERTTPAGRFVASFGRARGKRKVFWVDYATAIALHPTDTANPKERRLQRLRSRTPRDNYITHGCINVSAAFYEKVVRPTFTGTSAIVYILPQQKAFEEVFPTFQTATTLAAAGDHGGPADLQDPGASAPAAAASAAGRAAVLGK